jgi:hypothetical protein
MLSKLDAILYDNARPHTAAHAVESFRQQSWSGSFLTTICLVDTKNHWEAIISPVTKKWNKEVNARLLTQQFFSEGIQKLVGR